ncbi:MAG: hypothetical protein ACLQQ4_04480 [Bacteroidia bacterium]
MKKLILTATLAICALGLFAQGSDQLISKKGEMYLPESGDWSISFSADPFLNYFGNFLSSAGNHAPVLAFPDGNTNTIMGKYFVDNQTAYRGILRIGINSAGQDNYVNEDVTTAPTPPALPSTVTDHASWAQHFVGLGAGYEKRRGKTRLQCYYGGEFMFFLAGSSYTYTYGNAYTSTFQSPNSTTWSAPSPTANLANPSITPIGSGGPGTNIEGDVGRLLSVDYGSTFGLNLQGFIGFEYFFMPKISVGGEYTWGITFSSTGKGTENLEVANGSASTTVSASTGASSTFSLDSGLNSVWGNSGGDLYINFHF